MGAHRALRLHMARSAPGRCSQTQIQLQRTEASGFLQFSVSKNCIRGQNWEIGKHLNEEEFKMECKRWDVNEVIFTGIWRIYHPLMRVDFALFDQYENTLTHNSFCFDLTVFHGTQDKMISIQNCQEWRKITQGEFELVSIKDGNHLFPLVPEQKVHWLNQIVERL